MCNDKFKIDGGVVHLSLTQAEMRKLYAESTREGKDFLEAVCTDKSMFLCPSLDDYKTIKSYEDACTALGVEPLKEDALLAAGADAHIIALMKLETISQALWGREFKPVPQGEWDGHTYYWFVWWAYYSKKEVERIKAKRADYSEVAALFGGDAHRGADAGFGFLDTSNRPAHTDADFGFRLCQQSEERARYFAVTFAELWAEYLAYSFVINERII